MTLPLLQPSLANQQYILPRSGCNTLLALVSDFFLASLASHTSFSCLCWRRKTSEFIYYHVMAGNPRCYRKWYRGRTASWGNCQWRTKASQIMVRNTHLGLYHNTAENFDIINSKLFIEPGTQLSTKQKLCWREIGNNERERLDHVVRYLSLAVNCYYMPVFFVSIQPSSPH